MITMRRLMSVTTGTRDEVCEALGRLRDAAASASSWALHDSACEALAELNSGALIALCAGMLYAISEGGSTRA